MEIDRVQFNQIPKMIKVVSRRTGRLFYKPVDQMSALSSQRLMASSSSSSHSSMQNPVVLASLVAGFVGVLIVFILIFTIWIRRRCNYSQSKIGEISTELGSCSAASSFENMTTLDRRYVSNDTFFTVTEDTNTEDDSKDEDRKITVSDVMQDNI